MPINLIAGNLFRFTETNKTMENLKKELNGKTNLNSTIQIFHIHDKSL